MTTKIKLITALKIWVVIYPSITGFLYFMGEPLATLPLYQRTLILTILLVPWIVFAGLPLVNRLVGLISSEDKKTKP
jgi:antibiotic biosynthesis monooxygenase (ABM) superfamily enzyme